MPVYIPPAGATGLPPYNPPDTEQTIEITLKNPVESSFADVQLPSSEPTTPQFQYTLTANDFPTFNPSTTSSKYVFFIVVGGYNGDTASANLYYKTLKNNVTISTNNTMVTAGYLFYLWLFIYDVKVGDTIGVKFWDGSYKFYWNYYAWQVQPTRIYTPETLNYRCQIISIKTNDAPILTGTNAPLGLVINNFPSFGGLDITQGRNVHYYSRDILQCTEGHGIFRLNLGDVSNINGGLMKIYAVKPICEQYRNIIPIKLEVGIWTT
jgi:hypothetical protein